jgi:hypothetical protein
LGITAVTVAGDATRETLGAGSLDPLDVGTMLGNLLWRMQLR